MSVALVAAAAIAVARPSPASPGAEGPVALQPSGKWTVEYADAMCVLSRSYGAKEDMMLLALRPYPLSTRTEVVLFTRPRPSRAGRVVLRLSPTGVRINGSYQRVKMPGGEQSAVSMSFDEEALAGLPQAQAISLTLDGETQEMAVPGAAGAVRALEACQSDLLKSWDVDAQELTGGRTRPRPKGSIGTFFGAGQYPLEAVAQQAQGRVVAVIKVSTAGSPITCTVVQRAHPALDAQTCRIVQERIRFDPGLDADGKPREAHFVLPVSWLLEY